MVEHNTKHNRVSMTRLIENDSINQGLFLSFEIVTTAALIMGIKMKIMLEILTFIKEEWNLEKVISTKNMSSLLYICFLSLFLID